jgi:uncharacterized protein (DUF1778 family)
MSTSTSENRQRLSLNLRAEEMAMLRRMADVEGRSVSNMASRAITIAYQLSFPDDPKA